MVAVLLAVVLLTRLQITQKPGHDGRFALALTAKSGSFRCSVLHLFTITLLGTVCLYCILYYAYTYIYILYTTQM